MTAIFNVFRRAFLAFFEDKVSRQAAALAYYGLLSLAPLLIITITIAGLFFGQSEVQQQVVNGVSQQLGDGSGELIQTVLKATYGGDGGILATVFSIILLLIASTNIFFQLKESLNRIWNVDETEDDRLVTTLRKFLQDRLFAAVGVVGVVLLILASQIFNTMIALVISFTNDLGASTATTLQVLNVLAMIATGSMIVSLVFRYLPDKKMGWYSIWVGSVVTAILFTVGQHGITLYLENSTVASAYGAAGAVIVILLWIYYTAMIFLFGAEFTQAFEMVYTDEPTDDTRSDDRLRAG
jgi:membrane protein